MVAHILTDTHTLIAYIVLHPHMHIHLSTVIHAHSWYAVHCTSMNNTNQLISGDNKGHASYLMERDMNSGALPGQVTHTHTHTPEVSLTVHHSTTCLRCSKLTSSQVTHHHKESHHCVCVCVCVCRDHLWQRLLRVMRAMSPQIQRVHTVWTLDFPASSITAPVMERCVCVCVCDLHFTPWVLL